MSDSLSDIVNSIILNSSNQDRIMPSWVANQAYTVIHPSSIVPSPLQERLASTEYLKEIARRQLRGKFEPTDDADAAQHDLFPDLQIRYPIMRGTQDGEPLYVKLEHLTDSDIAWNVQRLRSEAGTKMKHARALQQFAVDRKFAGKQAA